MEGRDRRFRNGEEVWDWAQKQKKRNRTGHHANRGISVTQVTGTAQARSGQECPRSDFCFVARFGADELPGAGTFGAHGFNDLAARNAKLRA